MMGGSISGLSIPISESLNAPSCLNRMSMNSCLSTSDGNPVPICIFSSHSGVSRDPHDTLVPSSLQDSDSSITPTSLHISPSDNTPPVLAPPPGFTPLGNGISIGLIFQSFHLYIVHTTATSFFHCLVLHAFA